jgi:hypothetical protein
MAKGLAALLNKFHPRVKFLPEELGAAYAYLFLAEKVPVWENRKSKHGRNFNKTLHYLKDIIVRNELYTIADIEGYYQKKHDDVDRLFKNIKSARDN